MIWYYIFSDSVTDYYYFKKQSPSFETAWICKKDTTGNNPPVSVFFAMCKCGPWFTQLKSWSVQYDIQDSQSFVNLFQNKWVIFLKLIGANIIIG